MNLLAYFRSAISRFFHRARVESELEEELRSHIQLRVDNLERLGLSAAEAKRRARIEFGSTEKFKEECREAIAGNFVDILFQDVRFSLRLLRKSSAFTFTVILTMAIGIGATTAIFSVVDATLLQPLPYPQPDQLVYIQTNLSGLGAQDVGLSQPELHDLQHSGMFEQVSPAWFDENNLTGSSLPARVRIDSVAPGYFVLLKVQPQLGRTFDPGYDAPGYIPEVVISDGLWKRVFGSDPHILDKSIRMDTDLYRIIGVMPPRFHAPGRTSEERNVDVWAAYSFYGAPLPDQPPRNRRNIPGAIARLSPSLTLATAQKRLDALVASLQQQFPEDYPPQSGWRLKLVSLRETIVGNVRQPLVLLLSAVGLVLVISCVNVANLLLARASARAREMAVRQALGAGRARLTQQLLTESLVLALLGGLLGIALLAGMKDFLMKLVPDNLPRLNQITLSWPVLLFSFGGSLLAGIIFGLAPALRASRLNLTQAINQQGRGASSSPEQTRARRLLVVSEFALSLVLMVAAGLLLHSFWDLLNVRLGFNPESVLSVRTRLPYPNDTSIDKYATAAQEAPFLRELARRCTSLPGVEEVALGDTASIPLDRSQKALNLIAEGGQFLLTIEGHDLAGNEPSAVERSKVTPEYFHLLGIPLLRGRLFDDSDTDKTPQVAVINEGMAQTYWPDEDCLGKRFRSTKPNSPWLTVIAEIANARTQSLAQAKAPQFYQSIYQTNAKHLAILLRGHFDNAALAEDVRKQVQSLDPTLPVFGAQTLTQAASDSLAQRRISMQTVALFALTALLLAALGIYGVVSYIVTERTHEIGIRLALGAQTKNILRMVLGQGISLALRGAAAGLLCALLVARFMASLLYGVPPIDPAVFLGVPLLLFAVALLATYIPARRATKVDPIIALRDE